MVQQEGGGQLGRLHEVRPAKHRPSLGKGGDGETVPRCQDLLVATGLQPLGPGRQQRCPEIRRGQVAGGGEDVEAPGVVALGRHPEPGGGVRGHPGELVVAPEVVGALDAAGLGVLPGEEAAFGPAEAGEQVLERLDCDPFEEWVVAGLPGVGVEAGEEGAA